MLTSYQKVEIDYWLPLFDNIFFQWPQKQRGTGRCRYGWIRVLLFIDFLNPESGSEPVLRISGSRIQIPKKFLRIFITALGIKHFNLEKKIVS
jgi:hypothetical protein